MHNQTPMLTVNLYAAPDFTGRVMLYLEDGHVKSDIPVPDDHLVCSLDAFIELARRCGDGFQKITVPTGFTGNIFVTARNGLVTSQQELTDKHFVATLSDIAEIAQQAGLRVKKPNAKL